MFVQSHEGYFKQVVVFYCSTVVYYCLEVQYVASTQKALLHLQFIIYNEILLNGTFILITPLVNRMCNSADPDQTATTH